MPTGGLFNWMDSLARAQTWTNATPSITADTWPTVSNSTATLFGYQTWQMPDSIKWATVYADRIDFDNWLDGLVMQSPAKDTREPTEEEFLDLLE